MYVDDHCSAINQVLLDGKSGESYNISSTNEINNLSIVKKILDIMNKSDDLIEFVDDRPGHDLRYSLDSSKIRHFLKWKDEILFDDGIRRTIDWVLKQSHDKNLDQDALNSTPWKN